MDPGPLGRPAGSPAARPAAAEKPRLRQRILATRAAITPDERKAAARHIRDALLSLPEAAMAGTVAAYYSAGTEPDTHGLVYALWKRGSYVLLPQLREAGSELDWAEYEGPDSLAPGRFGLLEPVAPGRGHGAIARASLVIVPALAVDRTGVRLGRGGGWYDRALARVADAVPAIALLYDTELVGALPAEPHDRRVSMIARPGTGITHLG